MSPEYVAGFFDGEGSISIIKTQFHKLKSDPSKRVTGTALSISIANTNLAVLQSIAAKYGGKVYHLTDKRPASKQGYLMRVLGREKQIWFLGEIKPFSIIKREQIEIALDYLSTQRERGYRVTTEDVDRRLIMCARVAELNRRGCHQVDV